jgi:hypothetical protein
MTASSSIRAAIEAGVYSARSAAGYIYAFARDPETGGLVTVEAVCTGTRIRPLSAYITTSPTDIAFVDKLLDKAARRTLAKQIRACLAGHFVSYLRIPEASLEAA